jgi:hypothetical protein
MSLSTEAAFDALCEELHANKAERKHIGWSDTRAPLLAGYGRRLGQALRGNTFVSDLYLDLRPSQVNGENGDAEGFVDDNISMILQFLRKGASLQVVTFGQGSSVYTNPCLQAISENPNIQDFTLDYAVEDSAALLATWVGTTQTLQRLELLVEMADDDQVAAALGANSSITHLVVEGMSQSSKAVFLDEIYCNNIGRIAPQWPRPERRCHLRPCSVCNVVLSYDSLAQD